MELALHRSPGRPILGAITVLSASAALVLLGRSSTQPVVSAVLGVAAMLVTGSLVEWLVHGQLMHRRWKWLKLPYELHHRAHHWIHYPPNIYLRDQVTYVPVARGELHRIAHGHEEALAAGGQGAFYASFIAPIVAPAWWFTHNLAFAIAAAATGAALVFLAVHVHDSVHCPGHSPLERFRWFWALDRHHYLHHIDTKANRNFLLPLADLLLGTLRTEATAVERARWPSYQTARRTVRAVEPST